MTSPRPPLTRRSSLRVLPLEARLMFDAAAAVDVTKNTEVTHEATGVVASPVAAAAAAPEAAAAHAPSVAAAAGAAVPAEGAARQTWEQAIAQVNDLLARLPHRDDFAALLQQSFGGAGTDPAVLNQRIQALGQLLQADGLHLQVELRGSELHGAYAAYTAHAPGGGERIYLNADWLKRSDSQAVAAALLEEVGHAIDQRLNAGVDTPGDEGEHFSALVRGENVSAFRTAAMLADADQDHLMIDGSAVDVEFSELSVPFSEGFIGTQGTSNNKANGILTFATLGITRASFYQDSSSGSFATQGNDIPGGLRLSLSSGSVITITGAINWRVTQSGSLYAFGFLPDTSTSPVSFSYGAGSTYTISNTSNFGLELVGVTYNPSDNSNITGNAATTGLLDALNNYLAQVQANDPNGPVTADSQSTSDTTPTLTGTATLGGGESLSVLVNGVTYTTGNGLSLSGSNWSLTIPNGNALSLGTYSVTAVITNGSGYTLTDSTSNELTIVALDTTAPVVTSGQSFSYAENQSSGTTLGTVAATDAVGVTGYRFSSSSTTTSADGYFSINSSGQISLTTAGATAGVSSNDYETSPNSFTYGVQARDAAGNWSSAVNVTLNVTDVDDTAPVVTSGQSFNYAENQSSGTTLGTVAATDAVGVTGYRFSSSGTTTSADGYFSINSSGQISLTTAGATAGVSSNDYETSPNSFTYGVQARDAAGNWSSAVNVTLNVTDVDDTAPVVTSGQSFSYAENQSSGTTLGTVAATDAVGVTGYRFSSSGTTTSADGYFSINSSGQISLTTAGATAGASSNDYEISPNSFIYGVQARDAAGNWSSAVNVTLNVTNLNEAAADTVEATEDTPAAGNLLVNDQADSIVSFSVEGMSSAAGGTITLAGKGTLTIAADGSYAFQPAPDWHGQVPLVTYLTNAGDAATLSIAIIAVNDAPRLAADAMSTFQNVAWEGRLPAGTDAEGDTLAYSLQQGPSHGTVTVNPDGSYRYVPADGYSGNDAFQVQVSDGQGGTAQAWVSVTVQPPPSLELPAPWDLGTSNSDRQTSADLITLAGQGNAGETLNLYSPGGQLLATTTVDAQGRWSVVGIDMRTLHGDKADAPAGAIGRYTFTVRAVLPNQAVSAPVSLAIERDAVPVVAPQAPRVAAAPTLPVRPAEPTAPTVPSEAPHPFDSALRSVETRPEAVVPLLRPSEPARPEQAALVVRESNVADIYTRPGGFQIMVNPSPEPALKVFRGLDDQVAKSGATVNLQLPADTFVHTQVNETIVLQATLADGRPLPRWLQFDGRTGTLSGEAPREWREDLVIRVIARDSQGREATAMMRIKAGDTASRQGAGLSRQLMQGHTTRVAALSGHRA